MDKDRYIQITIALYKITLLFPKKEPLRYKLREVAVNILAGAADSEFAILDRFFEVVRAQNWVSAVDILEIQSNYANLRRDLEVKEKDSGEKQFAQNLEEKSERASRQEKIMDFLKENAKAQVWEVKKVFPEVSKRTLRRDFEFLLKQGVIQRIGERNNTFYQIKSI